MKILLVLFLLFSVPAQAVMPDEQLANPVLEERARSITKNLRCMACPGQGVDDSNAPLAADVRRLVRMRITAGDTDQQIYDYLQSRYGDTVLMQPPMTQKTFFLWLIPGIVFLSGFGFVLLKIRKA